MSLLIVPLLYRNQTRPNRNASGDRRRTVPRGQGPQLQRAERQQREGNSLKIQQKVRTAQGGVSSCMLRGSLNRCRFFNERGRRDTVIVPSTSALQTFALSLVGHEVKARLTLCRHRRPQLFFGSRLASDAFRSLVTRLRSPGGIASTSRVRFGSFAVMIACAASISVCHSAW